MVGKTSLNLQSTLSDSLLPEDALLITKSVQFDFGLGHLENG